MTDAVHVYTCSNGHEQQGKHIPFGHVVQCQVCKEVCVKVYPMGGGREWVIMTPEQIQFHRLVENSDD